MVGKLIRFRFWEAGMATFRRRRLLATTLAAGLLPTGAAAQGTAADYARAEGLRAKYEAAAVDIVGAPSAIGDTHTFWYRKSTKGGEVFERFDADSLQKQPLFDHGRIAASLSRESGATYNMLRLPFTTLTFTSDGSAFTSMVDGTLYRCVVADAACTRAEPARGGRGMGSGRTRTTEGPRRSPDGKWEALVDNFNVGIREVGSRKVTHLSVDGSEGNYYDGATIVWSPDSKKIAASKVRPGYRREVHYVESSPEDQLQPKHSTLTYAKPGDVLDVDQPVLFIVDGRRQVMVDNSLFPNPYQNSELVWEGQPRVQLRIQPAGPSGLPHHRGRWRDRQGPRGRLGRAEDVLQLSHRERIARRFREEVQIRPERRARRHLDVGARRLESPVPHGRYDGSRQESDHERELGRSRCPARR